MSLLSRVAIVAGRVFLRNAVKQPVCLSFVKPRFVVSARGVSTQSELKNELIEALENEIKAEQTLENDNLGGSTRPTIPGFQISTNQAEVRLTKTFGSEKILVVFNVNHSVDVEEDDEEGPGATPMPMAMPPFSLEIIKGDKRLCFNLSLIQIGEHEQFDFRVEEFFVAQASHDGNEDVPDEVYASSGRYIDPDLHDILFVNYLQERGIDEGFCSSLVQFATHYEHSEYVRLLKNIKDFVAKN